MVEGLHFLSWHSRGCMKASLCPVGGRKGTFLFDFGKRREGLAYLSTLELAQSSAVSLLS